MLSVSGLDQVFFSAITLGIPWISGLQHHSASAGPEIQYYVPCEWSNGQSEVWRFVFECLERKVKEAERKQIPNFKATVEYKQCLYFCCFQCIGVLMGLIDSWESAQNLVVSWQMAENLTLIWNSSTPIQTLMHMLLEWVAYLNHNSII